MPLRALILVLLLVTLFASLPERKGQARIAKPADKPPNILDPHQLNNVAAEAKYEGTLKRLRARVNDWMKRTHDPRIDPAYYGWDAFPYYGPTPKRNP